MNKRETRRWVRRAMKARAAAGRISTLEDGDFRTWWVPRLAGKYVMLPGGTHKFPDRADAVQAARDVRASLEAPDA